jgi:hypothetical protein
MTASQVAPRHAAAKTEPSRWLGVGHSTDDSAERAGRSAAADAISGRSPELVMVFCSERYDLRALLASVRSQAGSAEVIGCSTAGEIATNGASEASVVVMALGGSGFTVRTALATGAAGDLRRAGATAASCVSGIADRPHQVLLLITDGLAGDQQEIVRGAYSVAGASVPLVGGCAGDDLKMRATHQLYGDSVLRDAVIGAAIGSDAPLGIGVRHGWQRVGEPMLVSRSANNRVYELDDRPALDAYLDRLNAPPAARTEPAAFTYFAQTHPLGLNRRSGEEQVRFVADADFADRSLGCIAEVPQGGLAWLMEGDADSVLAATDAACADALASLAGNSPLGLVAFDCIARKGVLGGHGVSDEVARVARHANGAPVAGFYTYGEIARTQGISGFHNQTLVVLALS